MIPYLAERVASIFIANGAARKEDADIYIYAVDIVLSTVLNVIVCLVISAFLSRFIEGIIFMVCFAGLRTYAGGHHAKQHIGCIATFSCMLITSLVIINARVDYSEGRLYIVTAILSCVIIMMLAPVEHNNKPIPVDEIGVLRRKSRTIALLLCVIITVGIMLSHSDLFYIASLSMVAVCGSMVYATIRGGEKSYEKERKK